MWTSYVGEWMFNGLMLLCTIGPKERGAQDDVIFDVNNWIKFYTKKYLPIVKPPKMWVLAHEMILSELSLVLPWSVPWLITKEIYPSPYVIVLALTFIIHLFVVLATWISSCIMDFFLQPNIIYHKYIMGCLEYLFRCELKNISLHLFFIPAKSKLFLKGWVQYVFILGLEGCASSCAMAPTTYYSCGHLTRHDDLGR